jgi:hypothetical protein
VEKFEISFTEAIRSSIQFFIIEHRFILKNYEELKKTAWNIGSVRGFIEFAFGIISSFG